MTVAEQIGTRIKDARTKAGYTQKELAERSGMATVTVQQYERGVREPRSGHLQRIADTLGITSDYLYGLTDDPDTRLATQADFDHFGEKEPPGGWGLAKTEREMLYKFRHLPPEDRLRIELLVEYDFKRYLEKKNAPDDDPGQ